MSLQPQTATFTPDNLFAGYIQPVVTGEETIAEGAGVLPRGAVLGKVTATKKCVIVDSAFDEVTDPIDGSETVYAILAEAVDATDGDVKAPVYYTGEFNESELTFGGDDDADTHRTDARNIGIFFKTAVKA
jgi:hypothetical protein